MFWFWQKETIENGYGTTVTIKPSRKAIEKSLEKSRKKLKKQTGPYKKVSVSLDQWVQKNFKTEGKKVGGWKSFSENNKRWLSDRSAKLLQDTGRLRSSFRPFATLRNAGIGSFLKYSKPHNEGLGYLPKRQMLPDKDDKEILEKINKIWPKHIKDSFNE